MGERKVLNHYIPADFDPKWVPKAKSKKKRLNEVRNMLPMTVRCNKCGEYMYRGKKYAARVEYLDERYLGIRKVRLYGKCTHCSNPFTIKTDPKNDDYEVEEGVTRNFESWKIAEREKQEAERKKEASEEGDAMKKLENRTIESKREMDALGDLDALKAMSRHAEKVDIDALIAERTQRREKNRSETREDAEQRDENLVAAFAKRKRERRIVESEDDARNAGRVSTVRSERTESDAVDEAFAVAKKLRTDAKSSAAPRVKIVRKRKISHSKALNEPKRTKDEHETTTATTGKKSTPNVCTPSGGVISGTRVGLVSGDYVSSSSSSSDDE